MPIMTFTMTKSTRVCYLGHTDTYDIQGADQATQEWLQDWNLYCNTCKALTLDADEFAEGADLAQKEGAIGFVSQVPIDIKVVDEEDAP